jgi:hypothetical protein
VPAWSTAVLIRPVTSLISAVSSARRVSRGGGDERRRGQPRDPRVVAGQQAVQFGVGAVGQRGALADQLGAVVTQGPQVRGLPDRQAHRRQAGLPGGEAGDGDRADLVGLALPGPAGPFPAGQAGRHLHDLQVAGEDQADRGAAAVAARALDPHPCHPLLDQQLL